MKKAILILCGLSLLLGASACAPKVGSDKWCANMKEKPKADWTASEAEDYAKNCLLK